MFFYVITLSFAWFLWKLVGGLIRWQQRKRDVAGVPTIPGGHWLFGILSQITPSCDMITLVQRNVQETRHKLLTAWVFIFPIVLPTHPDTVKPVLKALNVPKDKGWNGPFRMQMPWLGDSILNSDGQKWERNRRLLTPAFHFDTLRPYVGVMNEVADVFMDKIRELSVGGASVDIYSLSSRATLDTMLRCAFSYKDTHVQNTDKQHPYVEAVHRLVHLLVERILNPVLYYDFIFKLHPSGREFHRLCDYVHDFSSKIIQARKKEIEADPSKVKKRHLDFLDILLTAVDPDGVGLTDIEIRDEVDTFMFGGHDTTSSAISWAMYAMAQYPDMQRAVREEVAGILNGRDQLEMGDLTNLPYTTCFIKEVLRMYSPVNTIARRLREPLTVGGVTLQPDQVITISLAVIHHNPDLWENHWEFRPERFLPENSKGRDPFSFLPFSAGQRNCIGQNFAMNEIKVMLSKMVMRYNIKPDTERPAEILHELVTRAKDGIYLYFEEM